MGNGWVEGAGFSQISDPVLLHIFRFLSYKDLVKAGEVCKRWGRVEKDGFLWKKLFVKDYKLEEPVVLSNKLSEQDNKDDLTFRSEYKRLKWETPLHHWKTIKSHTDEVLHVSFSPNGKFFATSSKDQTIKLWEILEDDIVFVSERDMMEMARWKYTQFSKFNADSSLLMVSGVHFGRANTAGELAVFEIDLERKKLSFRCRVLNRPYDVFGCWFDNQHILNGELYQIGFMNSSSHIWLCKASQDTTSERTAVLAPLCKFINRNGNNLRMLLVGSYVSDLVSKAVRYQKEKELKQNEAKREQNLDSKSPKKLNISSEPSTSQTCSDGKHLPSTNPPLGGSSFCDNCRAKHVPGLGEASESKCSCICHGPVTNKLLIYATGSDTYVPHQVAFKLIWAEEVLDRLNAEVMPDERREEIRQLIRLNAEKDALKKAAEEEVENEEEQNSSQLDSNLQNENDNDSSDNQSDHELEDENDDPLLSFDRPDHVIEMNGHVIGISLSHDERYLMVNVRPWPSEYVIDDPFTPPPLSEDIEIRVIDMYNLSLFSFVYKAHKGFTPNDECFFLFLDANKGFLASGSEDSKGYIWSRDYMCLLGELEHSKVVNSVAINPADPEMLVSVSDDHSIKIWKSLRRIKVSQSASVS